MKNVVITILVILVLGLGGYLVYDKVIDKGDTNINDDTSQSINKDYVGVAFSDSLTIDWPTDELGKETGDPDKVTKKVEIPKILIETDSTKIINDKIYNDYIYYIKMFEDNYKFETFEKAQIINITYDYKVKEDIIYIIIKTSLSNSRADSDVNHMVYYYDIENDKVLTVDEICSKYNIDIKQSFDESADKIYAVMPTNLDDFDVYYTQKDICLSFHCKDKYTHINKNN